MTENKKRNMENTKKIKSQKNKLLRDVKNVLQKKSRSKSKSRGVDTTFLVLVCVLLGLGLIMMLSASYAFAYYRFGDSFNFIKKQLAFAIIGLVGMFFVSKIDYHIYKKFTYPLFGVSFVLLIGVLFSADISGAKRWFHLGPLGTFQPSELMKFAIILLFAFLISKNYRRMGTFTYGVFPFLAFLGAVSALMLLQPHLSGTVLIGSIGLIMMFVGGTKYRYFLFAVILMVVAIIFIVGIKGIPYIETRLSGWIDPGADTRGGTFQTWQSLIAIGSGGPWGLGLGQSRQKFLYLPEPHNDFVFSIVCEELGFIGATVVILLFVLFCYRGLSIAGKAPDKFGAMMALGITAQIGVQAMLNIAVVTNTIPNTGISLPFFSYGGTSLLMLLLQMGIVLNISRQAKMIKS